MSTVRPVTETEQRTEMEMESINKEEKKKVTVRGKQVQVPVLKYESCEIVLKGGVLKKAEIFDEYWLETDALPDPLKVIESLQKSRRKPDIFVFSQPVPDTELKYDFLVEIENRAVIRLTTFEDWFQKKISASIRRNIRLSERKGIEVHVSVFDEAYVKGIMAIYNESPIRQGRRFWHYGKPFETVKEENGTYSERSTFLAAFHEDEMIGYCKIVWNKNFGAIMQIMSRSEHYDKHPTEALMAEAVRQCAARGKPFLLYERYHYGRKEDNSLTEFKRRNGFERIDVPRYYAPVTMKGRLALKLGLHKSRKDRLPRWAVELYNNIRRKIYNKKIVKKVMTA